MKTEKNKLKCEFGYVLGDNYCSKPECKKCVKDHLKCQNIWFLNQDK